MINTVRNAIKDKKVLVLGYGREGKSSLKMIEAAGGYRKISVADRNDVITDFPVELITGKDYQKCLDEYDIVFKSPGIVLEKPLCELKCKITSQTELFFERYRNQIVGITGTKGKSTTTTLIHNILKEAGFDTVLAGNIGIPAFDIWENVKDKTVITFEMSSHQLEYMTVSPHIAVYLNIHEEHLDHYGTMDKYIAAKENIYKNQTEGDILFVNELIKPSKNECRSDIVTVGYTDKADIKIEHSDIYYNGGNYSIPVDDIHLLGEHNYYNIAVAYGVCYYLGVNKDDFTKGICTYETLPHRLQYIGTVDGIKYYDDSISTICDTTIQALKSIKDVETVLIGGMDRGIDYGELIDFLSTCKVSNIILMAATGKRIYEEMQKKQFSGMSRVHRVETLDDAVELAKKITPGNTSCVMSPAAASYGIYKNFEERGEVFNRLVHGIKE